MRKFEITGTPAPITFVADSFETACIVVLTTAKGHFGVREVGGHQEMPMFRCPYTGHAEQWTMTNLDKTLDGLLDAMDRQAVIAALESFTPDACAGDIVRDFCRHAQVVAAQIQRQAISRVH
jgi:hypothetical protein